MAWAKGRYYYRSRREGRRVVREYVGKGELAGLMAKLDESTAELRLLDAQAARGEKEELDRLDALLEAASEAADTVARAALLAAGYRQHKRGEWRKSRGQARGGNG